MAKLYYKSTGQIVAEDYQMAYAFEAYGINYCCEGNIPLHKASELSRIPMETLIKEFEKVKIEGYQTVDYKEWPLDLIMDFIKKNKQRFIEYRIPEIRKKLKKLRQLHGEQYPNLLLIEKTFNQLGTSLEQHFLEEKKVLFPYIQQILEVKTNPSKSTFFIAISIKDLVQTLTDEHNSEGQYLQKIKQLSNDYTPPTNACTTFKNAFELLNAFDEMLRLCVHLENNVLFPKVIQLYYGPIA